MAESAALRRVIGRAHTDHPTCGYGRGLRLIDQQQCHAIFQLDLVDRHLGLVRSDLGLGGRPVGLGDALADLDVARAHGQSDDLVAADAG